MVSLERFSRAVYEIWNEERENYIQRVFREIDGLLSFNTGTFFLGDNMKNDRTFSKAFAYNHPVDAPSAEYFFSIYRNTFKQDYAGWMYHGEKSVAVKDSSFMPSCLYEETAAYRKIYEPLDLYYSAKMILIREGKLLGIFKFYRTKEAGDFTDAEIAILEALLCHIEECLYRIHPEGGKCEKGTNTYAFTPREEEVAQEIMRGKTNAQIAKKLFIAEGTVKKHVSNIFRKTGVGNRVELVKVLHVGNKNN